MMQEYPPASGVWIPKCTAAGSGTGGGSCTLSGGTTQLCEDPKAFDPAAGYEYRCYQIGMTEADCTDKGCYSSEHDGVMYCSCPASDAESCATMLPGEVKGTCLSGHGSASRDCVRVAWTWTEAGGGKGA